jgi:hypothetical protein
MTGEDEFQARREEKIREIARTGKTWQWPDTVQHQAWTWRHVTVLILMLATTAAICTVIATW